jgi:hypothetical protein
MRFKKISKLELNVERNLDLFETEIPDALTTIH